MDDIMETEIKDALNELRDNIRELANIREEDVEKQDIMTTETRLELLKIQSKSLQFNFIDGQIKSRLAFSVKEIYSWKADKLLELESIISDTLDDVRLLLLENIKSGRGKEMLSVVKLCSSPTVKVISTKKNIQKSFIDSAKVFNLDKERSEEILDDSKVLMSCGVLLESDILEVLNFPGSSPDPDPVTAVVKITTEPSIVPFFDIQVVVKSDNEWEIINTHPQEGYVEFPIRRMEYLFVISREKWDALTLSPNGLNYKSDDMENVTVRFPPGSLKKNCEIRIQVIPPNPVEQTECLDPNVDPDSDVETDIVSVTPRLWVMHDDVLKFEKPIVVTLPLSPVSSIETEADLFLIKWTDGDDVNIADTKIHLKEGFCEFEVDGFSGVSVGKPIGGKKKPLLKDEIDENYMPERGLNTECQIFILSDKSAVNTLWIEIVEPNRVEDLLKERLEKQHLVQMTNIFFPTTSVRYGQIIKIYARGGIRIHPNYKGKKSYLTIKYKEMRKYNHLRFQVELIDENSSAMLEFGLKKKKIYKCHFEAKEFLRQRSETPQTTPATESNVQALLTANKTLEQRSILALDNQIPIRQTEELATELNLSDNEVADLKVHQYKGETLQQKSFLTLAKQIPVRKTAVLAKQLNLTNNDVEDLSGNGYKGTQLIFQVLCRWRDNSDKTSSDMIQELARAMNTLSLKKIASKLLSASKDRRSLVNEDFAE